MKSQENPEEQALLDPSGGLLKRPWKMNTKYKSSKVGGHPENQAAAFKTGIFLGQPVGEKRKKSTSTIIHKIFETNHSFQAK